MKARRLALAWCIAGALALAAPAAAAPVKPKNATAKCTDGTYSTAKTHRGACTGHGGVATWLKEPKEDTKASKEETKAPKSEAKAPAKTTSKAPKPKPTPNPVPEPNSLPPAGKTPPAAKTPAPKTATSPRPANSPANATAQCNDGTYSFAAQHRGACSRHGGVKTWFK
jgi:outer membrane biosynthesis protein TonB